MKKGDVLSRFLLSAILFLTLIIIGCNAFQNITSSQSQTKLLTEYNEALIRVSQGDIGDKESVILSLPRNSALISFNIYSDFQYKYPEYNILMSGMNYWVYGTSMQRPSSCTNLRTCTCLCTGFTPDADAGIRDMQGEISCDNLFCLDGNYSWVEETRMSDVFAEINGDSILNRNQHYWVNSSIIVNSERQTNTPLSISYLNAANIESWTRIVPIVSGWQGTVGQGVVDVTIKKVEGPNKVRLCINQDC